MKNSMKQFEEDYNAMDQVSKNPTLVQAFSTLEQTFGRKEAEQFDTLLNDILKGKLRAEDLISPEDFKRLVQNRHYAGFSMSDYVKTEIK